MSPLLHARTPVALLAACLLLSAASAAPASWPSHPPIALFEPDLGTYPQNFAVAQGPDGTAYLGSTDGVLAFDGKRWSLLRMPNREIVRSLAVAGDGRLYIGGYDQFGWAERDANGVLQFHDLTPLAQGLEAGEKFADIWETNITPQGVFFRGVRHVFRFRPADGRIDLWRWPDRYGGLLVDGDELLLQFRGEGLRRLVADRWEPVPGSAAFQDLVERWIELPEGGFLAIEKPGRWLIWRDGKVEPADMPRGMPPSSSYTRGLALDDGTLALTRSDGHLDIVDRQAGTLQSSPVATGFLSGIVRAEDGGLLMSANAGLVHVQWPATWSVLDTAGVTGAAHGLVRWGERGLILTGAGLYERVADGYQRKPWAVHEIWDLLPLDRQRALLANSYSLLLVEGERTRQISSRTFYPRVLRRSTRHPAHIHVGTEMGFAVLTPGRDGPRIALNLDDLGAPNVTGWVELDDGRLLLGVERGGLRSIRLAADGVTLVDRHLHDEDEGIAYGVTRAASVAELAGEGVVVSTGAGFFRWNGARFEATDVGGLAAIRQPDQQLQLVQGPDGRQWAFDFARVYSREPGGGWKPEPIEAIRQGAIDRIRFDSVDGSTYLIANGGILRHSKREAEARAFQPAIRITAVERVEPDGTRSPLPLAGGLRLPSGDFAIAFRYAVTDLRRADATRYRTRMLGYRDAFDQWREGTSNIFSRIEPGEYLFEVEGLDSLGASAGVASYAFVIEPVWYASRPALVVWLLLALGGAAVLTRYLVQRRTELLAADKSNLERMVGERTRDLEAANRMLETMAHLDGLTGIPNRRRLDDYLDQIWVQCGARERPLAVLAIDVDHFKEFNDRHGHLAGDALLKRLAGLLTRSLRRTEDLAARYGGEEFLVVLPGAELAVAQEVAEALRERVAASSLGASISIGVASRVPRVGDSVADLVKAADTALYKAKASGRDQVSVADG